MSAPSDGHVLTELSNFGGWGGSHDWAYTAAGSPTGYYRFQPAIGANYSILYHIATGIWSDGSSAAQPTDLTISSTAHNVDLASANAYPEYLYCWQSNGSFAMVAFDLRNEAWSQNGGIVLHDDDDDDDGSNNTSTQKKVFCNFW
mgnify:CR=1 FL=1|tara:strand:+ start:2000 stop:2434 length:435 start_codon:yes stop_codon:yes gene_type:complete